MPPRSRPNIFFILVDDMGYGDFGRWNGGQSQTPNLDALIGESVCFSQSYTASCVCNPSRAALLTGRYPHRTGSIDTLEWRGLERLALRERTLADLLRDAGYRTGLVGKWHLGAFDPRYHPQRRGFHESICFRGGMHDYYRWRLERGSTVLRGDGRYLTDVWTEEAVSFVRRNRSTPFFLHLTYNAPHTPLQVPEEDLAPFADRADLHPNVRTLYGMMRRMDAGVGRVLDCLRDEAIASNTVVFFSSDNGPQFGGGLDRFNCQLHGAKGSVYEGGIRVPMLVRWPDGLPGGREVHDMVHFVDWLPTILELAGVGRPRDGLPLDGRSVASLLRGEGMPHEPARFWQWNRYTPVPGCNAAVRDGDWKLVRPAILEAMRVPPGDIRWLDVCMYEHEHFVERGIITDPEPSRVLSAPPPPELYNIAEDPLEQRNLAPERTDQVRRLDAMLARWFDEVEAERRAIGPSRDP